MTTELRPTVTINGTEYELSPLRCKHLREISETLAAGTPAPKGVYAEIMQWSKYIGESIKTKSPNFDFELLGELTLQEFTDTWNLVVAISGIKVVSKGEVAPAPIGDGSTVESASVPGSPTVM